jgi:hypothetical protein
VHPAVGQPQRGWAFDRLLASMLRLSAAWTPVHHQGPHQRQNLHHAIQILAPEHLYTQQSERHSGASDHEQASDNTSNVRRMHGGTVPFETKKS